jgi:RNA-directed DNA polymerase
MKAETANRYARTDTFTGSTARSYRPKPVRLAEIEKPGGGERGLGIPTVVDRMIQQAMHQVLNPLFDHEFSDSSFGYRKGKSAEQAVR